MRVYTNWKRIVLRIELLFLVMLIDNLWLDIVFMAYVILALLYWAHNNPSSTEIRGYLNTRLLDITSRSNLPIVIHRNEHEG